MMNNSSHRSKWASLPLGAVLIIGRDGIDCHRGNLVDRTNDGHVIWVTDGLGHRRLFHVDDNYDVEVRSDVLC